MSVVKNFRKSTRVRVKASIMIEGLTGKGKSGLALAMAKTLASSWDKIYCIDTENMALDLFEGLPLHTGEKIEGFNKIDLTSVEGYSPSNYAMLQSEAIKEGAEVVVIDSFSHAWARQNGVLDLVANIESTSRNSNKFAAWNDPKIIKEKNLIFDLVRSSEAHIITTIRSKEKFSLEYDEAKGKNEVVSLGEQQVQQDGLKYEPDLVLRMVSPGNTKGKAPMATVLKSRYAIFEEGITYEFNLATLKQLKDYIEEGVDPEILLEQQRQDYIKVIKEYGSASTLNMSKWKNVKENQGFKEAKIEDIPLDNLRTMFATLTEE